MQNISPPPAKHKGIVATLGGLLAIIAALAAILQFMGVAHFQDIFIHPTPTPTPLPVIAEQTYNSPSPGCDKSTDPSDIFWNLAGAKGTCESNGTILVQTDLQYVPGLLFEAENGYQLASNETLSADFVFNPQSTVNVCGGFEARLNKADRAGYGFYICTDGNWFIIKYTRQGGTPVVLSSSAISGTQETPSTQYSLVVTASGSNLQMAVGGGQTYSAQDSDFTLTEANGIVMSEESVITTYQPSNTDVSMGVNNFHYGQA